MLAGGLLLAGCGGNEPGNATSPEPTGSRIPTVGATPSPSTPSRPNSAPGQAEAANEFLTCDAESKGSGHEAQMAIHPAQGDYVAELVLRGEDKTPLGGEVEARYNVPGGVIVPKINYYGHGTQASPSALTENVPETLTFDNPGNPSDPERTITIQAVDPPSGITPETQVVNFRVGCDTNN